MLKISLLFKIKNSEFSVYYFYEHKHIPIRHHFLADLRFQKDCIKIFEMKISSNDDKSSKASLGFVCFQKHIGKIYKK